jgi:hypothetical protein
MSKFPASGPLSMFDIATAFGILIPVSMNDFVGKTLYNLDGSTYTVPSLPLSIQYFYDKYYTDPVIAPITAYYFIGTTTITPPSGQARNPISFSGTIWGGGGGGGGGGNGYAGSGMNGGGGGGGGGGSGGSFSIPPTLWDNTKTLTVSIGSGGIPGPNGGESGNTGGSGQNTLLTYDSNTYTAYGGLGGLGGQFGAWDRYGGVGGVGGTSNPGGTNGENGQTGAEGAFTGIVSYTGTASGGNGGTGVIDPSSGITIAQGGNGGLGGWANIDYSSGSGTNGIIGYDGAVKIIWNYH